MGKGNKMAINPKMQTRKKYEDHFHDAISGLNPDLNPKNDPVFNKLVNDIATKTKAKVSRELCYDVNKVQKYLWSEYKEEEKRAAEVEWEGRKRAEAFNIFAEETFHRLYTHKEQPLEENAPGSQWAQKLHKAMTELPEFERLRERCKGKDWWAGTAGTSIIEKLLEEEFLPPEDHVKDIQEYERSIKHLEKVKDKLEEDEQEKLQDQLDELQKKMDEAIDKDQEVADGMDESLVRNALRGALQQAGETLDDADSAMEMMSMLPGTDSGVHNGQLRPNMKLLGQLKGNKRFQNLIELVGRMERLAHQRQKEKARKGTNEVTGICTGDNISRMLPVELMNLADEDSEVLFYAKYYERALLEYYLKENPIKKKGPIVVLVDTSCSMANGTSDAWALATTLAIASIAHKQKRSFAVLLFDTKTHKQFIFKKEDITKQDDIIELLNVPFSGYGTNFEAPLIDATKIIENEKEFEEADIVMITDGEANIGEAWLKNFNKKQEELKFKAFSVLVGYQTSSKTNELFSDFVIHIKDLNDKEEQDKVKEVFEKL